MAEKKKKKQKEIKIPKKREKFIWFAASVIVAVSGYIARISEFEFPLWLKIVYPALLMFLIIICSQKTSIERFSYRGENGNKKMYIITSLIYYVFILVAVFYIFFALWVANILSV